MTDPLVPEGDGHTALTEEDRLGLIPTYIATRGELFDAEQRNIAKALLGRSPTAVELLDDRYIRDLHRSMFSEVWNWAGRYRERETNIGIAPEQIAVSVRDLVDDSKVWIEHGTSERDESAVSFHHRLVAIHPFRNGNGRHGRIAADYLVVGLGGQAFSWGAGLGLDTDELRRAYLHALHSADNGEIAGLLAFARA